MKGLARWSLNLPPTQPSSRLRTIPSDSQAAAQRLAGTRAEMVLGDWRELIPDRGPFDLIFLDAGDAANSAELAISMLAEGGILVKDDLTPGSTSDADPVREALLNDPRLIACRDSGQRKRPQPSSPYAAAHSQPPGADRPTRGMKKSLARFELASRRIMSRVLSPLSYRATDRKVPLRQASSVPRPGMIRPMHLVIASGILDLGKSVSSFGQTLALALTFFVVPRRSGERPDRLRRRPGDGRAQAEHRAASGLMTPAAQAIAQRS